MINNSYVIDLKEKGLNIEKIGGKALNLAKMSSACFNVPPAFIVSVHAYDFFIKKELEGKISEILDSIDFNNEDSISQGCSSIRSMIKSEELPENLFWGDFSNNKKKVIFPDCEILRQ